MRHHLCHRPSFLAHTVDEIAIMVDVCRLCRQECMRQILWQQTNTVTEIWLT